MLEKDIENLIAKYPDEFFPDSGFSLVGQQVKLGNCRADIVFIDKYKRKVIVEVKRGILSRDASGQVMEYYGLLKLQQSDDFVELILCANIIPPERKKFLEAVGIECKELGINFINQIAQKVSYNFINSTTHEAKNEVSKLPNSEKTWIFQANPQRYDILNALSDDEIRSEMHWEVNQYKYEISKGHLGIIWLSGQEAGIYAITEILINPAVLEEDAAEKKYWTDNSDKEGARLRIRMKILRSLINKPLTKDRIRTTFGLQNLSILKQPRGTNFPVTPNEWQVLRRLIDGQEEQSS